jgi:hypothetical protein
MDCEAKSFDWRGCPCAVQVFHIKVMVVVLLHVAVVVVMMI